MQVFLNWNTNDSSKRFLRGRTARGGGQPMEGDVSENNASKLQVSLFSVITSHGNLQTVVAIHKLCPPAHVRSRATNVVFHDISITFGRSDRP